MSREKAIELLKREVSWVYNEQGKALWIVKLPKGLFDQALAELDEKPEAGEFTEKKAIDLMGAAYTEYVRAYRIGDEEPIYPRNKYPDVISYMVSKIWPRFDQQAERIKQLEADRSKS